MGYMVRTKDTKFNMVMSEEEKSRLDAMAKSEERSAGAWIRAVINREYVEKFGTKPSKKPRRTK